MGLVVVLVGIGVSWLLLHLVIKSLEWVYGDKFSSWLRERNVSVSHLSVSIFTTRFNGPLSKWGRRWASFWTAWFSGGVVFALVGMLASTVFVCVNLFWLVFPSSSPSSQPLMTPVLPLVTVPASELIPYALALTLCTVLHELGHALAATAHSCTLDGVGLAFVALFPAAFTAVRPVDLELSPPRIRLRVFAAGVLHNAALCVVALVCVFVLPLFLIPFYTSGRGVYVASSSSPYVTSYRTITGVNGCDIRNAADWERCMHDVAKQTKQSFCVPQETLHRDEASSHDCCEDDYKGGLQCFHLRSQMYCLAAGSIVLNNRQCSSSNPCPSDSACVSASSPPDDRIMWLSFDSGDPVVMSGNPYGLWGNIVLSSFTPRFARSWMGGLDLRIHALFMYIFSLSAALGVLNMLPVHQLDGSHLLDTIWESMGWNVTSSWLEWIKTFTSVVLGVNLVLSSRALLLS